jgi:hypothetical protein
MTRRRRGEHREAIQTNAKFNSIDPCPGFPNVSGSASVPRLRDISTNPGESRLADLVDPAQRKTPRRAFTDPEKLKPGKILQGHQAKTAKGIKSGALKAPRIFVSDAEP